MSSKGPGITAPGVNIVDTWFRYRYDAHGMTRADVIKELNDALNRNYNNSRVYEWVQGNMSTPDNVLDVIDDDLESMLRWLFKNNRWPIKGVNIKALTNSLRPAIKKGD